MLLAKCPRLVGQCNVVTDPLRLRSWTDVSVAHYSLYDRSGAMVPDSGFFRGIPTYQSVGGPLSVENLPDAPVMPDGDYLWLGHIISHFGHFLVGALARLWAWDRTADAALRLVYAGSEEPDALFRIEHVRLCFEALGIGPERLLRVASPARFPRITIPEPSFVENFSVAPAYGATLRAIADRIVPAGGRMADDRLIYLSKARIRSGNRLIHNENELSEALARHGFETVHPEQLSFPEQIRLWSTARCATGFAGSAFHTSGFVGRRRLVTIANTLEASSNQALIDRIVGNESLFVHPIHGLNEDVSTVPGFHDAIVIQDPRWLADGIARAADGLLSGRTRPQSVVQRPRETWTDRPPATSFGEDVARHAAPTRAGATTWTVELPEIAAVNEIAVSVDARTADDPGDGPPLSIGISGNGTEWFDPCGCEPPMLVEGEPHPSRIVWRTPFLTLTRFVRIEASAGLSIREVELIGENAEWELGLPDGEWRTAPQRRRLSGRLRAVLAGLRSRYARLAAR